MEQDGFIDLDFAKIDIAREKRRGFPEIIYAPNKTLPQLKKIIGEFKKHTDKIFVSRLDYGRCRYLKKIYPSLRYYRQAKLAFLGKKVKEKKGYVLIITAGTSDIGVAEEAAVFLELTGNKVERIYDVGVAGAHRIRPYQHKLDQANIIIVVAGMEAALASMISGLTGTVLIGVPTSVGYGASFKGLAALLGMLNSCSPGVAVVNIDNGLGAGYFAHRINQGK